MGKPKKYDVRSINFGEVGHPARILVDKFVSLHGKTALSRLIRRLVMIYLMEKPEYRDWKAQKLIYERKELGKKVAQILERRRKVDEELRDLGVNPDELIY